MGLLAFASPAATQDGFDPFGAPELVELEALPPGIELPAGHRADEILANPFEPDHVFVVDKDTDLVWDSFFDDFTPAEVFFGLAPAPGFFDGPVPTLDGLDGGVDGLGDPGFDDGDALVGRQDPALRVFDDVGADRPRLTLSRPVSQTAIDDAYTFTTYEIALLVHLDAFNERTPYFATFQAIHDSFDWTNDHDRADTLRTFRAIDAQLASFGRIIEPALAGDYTVNPQFAIERLPSGMQEFLDRGVDGRIEGFEYAATLVRLAASSSVVSAAIAEADVAGLEAQLAATIETLEIAEDVNTLLELENEALRAAVADLSSVAVPEPPADYSQYRLLGAGAVGVVILAGLTVWFARRRRAWRPSEAENSVETHRLLAGAGSAEQIAAIMSVSCTRTLGAPANLFRLGPAGLAVVGSDQIVTESVLATVVLSRMPLVSVVDDDPAWPGQEVAVVAVPVQHQGDVLAVIAAHRRASEPFRSSDLSQLELIAPAVGGALARADEIDSMQDLAMLDPLTSLGNRRRLDGDLETSLSDALEAGTPVAFAMIDVDHFKSYNDTHGHGAGDEVLRHVGATIARCVRDSDVVYRYGGEEFSILLPGATPGEAHTVAERVRASIEAAVVPGEETQPGGRLTVSVGVATLETGRPDDLKDRADAALYEAKEAGRNTVILA